MPTKSKQIQIATLKRDAERLLEFCQKMGGRLDQVAPAEFWPDGDSPRLSFEQGRIVQIWLWFGVGDKPKIWNEYGTVELVFKGITSNSELSALGVGRVYVNPFSLEFPEIASAWQEIERFVKKSFTRVAPAYPHGTRKPIWAGPDALRWLEESNRLIMPSEDEYARMGLPPLEA